MFIFVLLYLHKFAGACLHLLGDRLSYAIGPLSVCLSCLPVTLVYCGQTTLTDQDETWHTGRPRPWPHCVRWGPRSPSPNYDLDRPDPRSRSRSFWSSKNCTIL